jgi:hypothetical protein
MPLPHPMAQLMWLAEQQRRLAHFQDHGHPEWLSAHEYARLRRTARFFQTREAEVLALLGIRDALPCDVAVAHAWPRLDQPHPLPDSLG